MLPRRLGLEVRTSNMRYCACHFNLRQKIARDCLLRSCCISLAISNAGELGLLLRSRRHAAPSVAEHTAFADSGEEPFIHQAIEFTDFPLTEIDLYCAFDGEDWTLMLPSEY